MNARRALILLAMGSVFIGMFLPVKHVKYTTKFFDGTGDGPTWEAISGIQLEFPLTLPFLMIAFTAAVLLRFGRGKGAWITALVLAVVNCAYAFFIYVVIVFEIFASVRVGFGFWLIALGTLSLVALSIAQLVRPPKELVRHVPNDELIDDL